MQIQFFILFNAAWSERSYNEVFFNKQFVFNEFQTWYFERNTFSKPKYFTTEQHTQGNEKIFNTHSEKGKLHKTIIFFFESTTLKDFEVDLRSTIVFVIKLT